VFQIEDLLQAAVATLVLAIRLPWCRNSTVVEYTRASTIEPGFNGTE
jgi:hypothetical protein